MHRPNGNRIRERSLNTSATEGGREGSYNLTNADIWGYEGLITQLMSAIPEFFLTVFFTMMEMY